MLFEQKNIYIYMHYWLFCSVNLSILFLVLIPGVQNAIMLLWILDLMGSVTGHSMSNEPKRKGKCNLPPPQIKTHFPPN